MKIHNVEQNTETWYNLRSGKITASNLSNILTPAKLELSKSADVYANKLIAELLLGKPLETYTSNAMQYGKDTETEAVAVFELLNDLETEKIGFVTNDAETYGASPDRLIGADGLLEVKCPEIHTHVGYLRNGGLAEAYRLQLQGQLWVTGREYVVIFSYSDSLAPVEQRVERDPVCMARFEEVIPEFADRVRSEYERLKR
jgi:hypothetical protein